MAIVGRICVLTSLASMMMKTMLLVGALAWLMIGLTGCGNQSPQAAVAEPAKPVLAVSVFPVADLAARIAGDRWQVVTLLPPGMTPHEYTVRPGAASALSAAKALIAVGPGLDEWAIRAGRAASGQRDIRVLTEALHIGAAAVAGQSQPARHHEDDEEHCDSGDHDEHEHHGHGADPHLWLDPVLTERIVDQIAGVLTRHDPSGRAVYEGNSATLKKDLLALDEEYRATLAGCRTRTLIVFHPGYAYLTQRYGLEQMALLGLGGVTPARLEQIVGRVEREHIRAVYREPQYESKWIDTLSRRTGAKVLVLDPLGHAGRSGYDSYFSMMRSNLAALKEGLNHGS
jgi:zinc transport system substrate-binding protein